LQPGENQLYELVGYAGARPLCVVEGMSQLVYGGSRGRAAAAMQLLLLLWVLTR